MAKRLAVALLLLVLLASSDAGELNGKHGAGSAVGEMKAPLPDPGLPAPVVAGVLPPVVGTASSVIGGGVPGVTPLPVRKSSANKSP